MNRFPSTTLASVCMYACVCLAMISGLTGCKDLVGAPSLPAGVPDPKTFRTPDGAMEFARATLAVFQESFGLYVTTSGLLTDELRVARPITEFNAGAPGVSGMFSVDLRIMPERMPTGVNIYYSDRTYGELQRIRTYATLSIDALRAYAPKASLATYAELFAIRGYAVLLLADLYCSGVPLSTIDFEGDYQYVAGSTSAQLYTSAMAQFDTAIAMAGDSLLVGNLARIGKARVYLGRAEYAAARVAVQDVPDGYVYQYSVNWVRGFNPATPFAVLPADLSMSNLEGGNGEAFVTRNDPRLRVRSVGTASDPRFVPEKYLPAVTASRPLVVADWIETYLIRAEAQYHTNDDTGMIETLNELRRRAITPAMNDTVDPGNDHDRLNLLLHERAYWLYLSGHRQSDFRRLVRNGERTQSEVYPAGGYPGGFLTYGGDVNVPIPGSEYTNDQFAGCIDRAP